MSSMIKMNNAHEEKISSCPALGSVELPCQPSSRWPNSGINIPPSSGSASSSVCRSTRVQMSETAKGCEDKASYSEAHR